MTMEKIPGLPDAWGEDLQQHKRPGVPMEIKNPADLPFNAPMVRARTGASTSPWHGLSGLMRKTAYKYPEHFAKRWLMLLAADRVDVLEHQVKRRWPVFAAAGGLGLVALLVGRRKKAKKAALKAKNSLEFSGAPITGGEPAGASATSGVATGRITGGEPAGTSVASGRITGGEPAGSRITGGEPACATAVVVETDKTR